MRHTPGPWRHVGAGIEARAFDGSWKWLTPVVHGGSPQQATANRALMAAAPELLAVVRDFRQKLATYTSVYAGDKELRRQLDACDSAIAKAEPGGTSNG